MSKLLIYTIFALFISAALCIGAYVMALSISDRDIPKYCTSAVNEADIFLLSCLMESECSVCSDEEKKKVASVACNRARIECRSLSDIIFESSQFETVFQFRPNNNCLAMQVLAYGPVDSTIIYFWNDRAPRQPWMNNVVVKRDKREFHNFASEK